MNKIKQFNECKKRIEAKNQKELDTVLTQILLNQREILNALSVIITSTCKGESLSRNVKTNVSLIDRYHETEQLLGLEWAESVPYRGSYSK